MTRSGARPDAGTGQIRFGTSGWSYDGWRGALYPKKLPKKDWLHYYGSKFSTAEINASFYRTPTLEAVKSWRRDTPRDFAFAWKASKFMTHWKRLLPTCENSIALMQTRLRVLGPKAVVVLFQLPHHFRKDTGRLRDFFFICCRVATVTRSSFATTPGMRPTCWTFSTNSMWLYASPTMPTHRHRGKRRRTTFTCAVNGPSGRYHGSYAGRTLKQWAEVMLTWQSERRDVFAYFDNDQKAAAPRDARRLIELIAR
jgi:uncharacterized protein YecE (DUF72 family)